MFRKKYTWVYFVLYFEGTEYSFAGKIIPYFAILLQRPLDRLAFFLRESVRIAYHIKFLACGPLTNTSAVYPDALTDSLDPNGRRYQIYGLVLDQVRWSSVPAILNQLICLE